MVKGEEKDVKTNKVKPKAKGATKEDKQIAKEKKKRRKKLHRVLKNHPEFELTFDMQIGIRYALGMENGGIKDNTRDRPPTLEEFDESIRLNFPRNGSETPPLTPPHSSRDFKFKTYAPKIFRRIRERFGISDTGFTTSVCGNFEYLSFKSNSKSGQFFFYSYDKRYMLKTMTNKECALLMKILPSYYQHVMDNPNTLLCRFYGMHRVKPAGNMYSFHFLIMESVFNTNLEIHTVFDLKGSTVNRFAKRGESVYKDVDFADSNFRFRLPKTIAGKLEGVIKADVAFLKEAGLMDYSLLVGVHYLDNKPKRIEYRQDRLRRLKDKDEKHVDEAPLGVPKKYNVISQPKKENVQMSEDLLVNDDNAAAPAQGSMERASQGSTAIPMNDLKARSDSARPSAAEDDMKNLRQQTAEHLDALDSIKSIPEGGVLPAHHGGLRSVDGGSPGNLIFYIGIIDILTQFGVRKSVEHRFMSLFKDGNQISCVHPSVYGNRFSDFLLSRIEGIDMKGGRGVALEENRASMELRPEAVPAAVPHDDAVEKVERGVGSDEIDASDINIGPLESTQPVEGKSPIKVALK
mmetsp:Transcript_40758/g.65529  ORF Transcript_40758/g.65529 Transcript_40758/m.65529 type:complete len:576 (+) Transcript_40758:90-1817(+)